MELPHLGKNCSQSSCKMLDFLPMKCDACSKIFCKDHIMYEQHKCPESYKRDNQVPVCPLCNTPIPLRPGQSPDVEVGRHIDSDCQSDPAKERRKVYTNRCSLKGCKGKELIPFTCGGCHKNYCIKHRHETDHQCAGFQGSGRGISSAGAAAVSRSTVPKSQPQPKPAMKQQTLTNMGLGSQLNAERQARNQTRVTASAVHNMQGTMTEDQALAQALAMSMSDQPQAQPSGSDDQRQAQEEADAALARALQQSEQEARRRPQQRPQQTASDQKEKSCLVS